MSALRHAPLRVGLVGCGAVGGALAQLMIGPGADEDVRRRLRLERILVRNPDRTRPAGLPSSLFATDASCFDRERPDVVVEATGTIEVPLALARSTLGRGASFVTANKTLVARHGVDLERLGRLWGGRFLFEGAVGGGVPVLRALDTSFAGTPIHAITGILNGTCNYVLTEMEKGNSFAQAIAGARERGYAEADAARDLDGRDAADKIAILAWRAWGIDPATVTIQRRGILPDPDALVHEARRRGERLRLVAACRQTESGVQARVSPVRLPPESELGRITGVANAVRVETEGAGSYSFGGPGAGGRATAAAMLGDLLSLARDESTGGRAAAEISPRRRVAQRSSRA